MKRILFCCLLLTGICLSGCTAQINQPDTPRFALLYDLHHEKENITEELKSNDQMLWVQKMNYIRNRVTEIVNKEIIYA